MVVKAVETTASDQVIQKRREFCMQYVRGARKVADAEE
jgi:hypothetical protein